MAIERMRPPKDGVYKNVPMAEYLAWDAWSASELKSFVQGPEYAYWYRHEREPTSSAATEFGTLAHLALLEPEAYPAHVQENVVWVPAPWNKNPGKADAAEARACGKIPVKADAEDRIQGLVRRCEEHALFRGLLELSVDYRELTAVQTCPESGIRVKARCDLASPTTRQIADLKTTEAGTDRDSFRRTSLNLGYWMSAPHYRDVFGQAMGLDFDTYLWLCVAQSPPYSPRVFTLDPTTAAAGEDYMRFLRRQASRFAGQRKTGWRERDDVIEAVGLGKYRLDELAAELEIEQNEAKQ